jgi:hypothetical protein
MSLSSTLVWHLPSGCCDHHRGHCCSAGLREAGPVSARRLGGYRFTPLSVETFGGLGKPMMSLLSEIRNLAISRGDGGGVFTKELFVSGILQELSVCLCKTNARLNHGVSGFFERASGV